MPFYTGAEIPCVHLTVNHDLMTMQMAMHIAKVVTC